MPHRTRSTLHRSLRCGVLLTLLLNAADGHAQEASNEPSGVRPSSPDGIDTSLDDRTREDIQDHLYAGAVLRVLPEVVDYVNGGVGPAIEYTREFGPVSIGLTASVTFHDVTSIWIQADDPGAPLLGGHLWMSQVGPTVRGLYGEGLLRYGFRADLGWVLWKAPFPNVAWEETLFPTTGGQGHRGSHGALGGGGGSLALQLDETNVLLLIDLGAGFVVAPGITGLESTIRIGLITSL